jgi:AcrR family transcriptional regulator
VPRTGRRPGASGTRAEILATARAEFAAHGYDGATIRGIAAAAGVDPALVGHYFGSKEDLFVAALRLPFDPADAIVHIVAAGTDGLGERMTDFFFSTWDNPDGAPFIALLRSVTASEQAAEMMRQFISRAVLARVAAALSLDQPQLRAALAASQLVGLALVRYVIKLEPIASAERSTLVREVGPTIQRYFRPAPLAGAPARATRGDGN